ncbi:MAG: glycerate kinase [Kiritimatiellae bacterium]|nr:glycerate kinase [Kiritimatiellia bacterium]
MKVVCAIDSFKGSLSSIEAGNAAAEGVRRVFPAAECLVCPVADGGEGTVEALVDGMGGDLKSVTVTGPAGRPVEAHYGLLPGGVAVMEMAQAAGITLVSDAERNPLCTTTFGVGEMILDAVAKGASRFIIGIGGSATNDGGAGMLQALGFKLLDRNGVPVPRGGGGLARLVSIEPCDNPAVERLCAEGRVSVACDVVNPLCGAEGASAVFGPQKGAGPAAVAALDAALARFAGVARGFLGVDHSASPGAGAAGGLGFAFKAFLGARLVPGVDLILAATRLEECLKDADVVITGEGRIDGQTVMGKAPVGVARLAKRRGCRVIAVCGCVGDGAAAVNAAGVDAYFPILRRVGSLAEALAAENAAANLSDTVEQVFRLIKENP